MLRKTGLSAMGAFRGEAGAKLKKIVGGVQAPDLPTKLLATIQRGQNVSNKISILVNHLRIHRQFCWQK